MVGKKTPGSTMKRSPVASELALANRPRRNISPKNLDLSAGLSWREERELKKALYASLQESKKCPSATDQDTSPIPFSRRSYGVSVATHTVTRRQSPRASKPVTSNTISSVISSTVTSPSVSSVSDVKISRNRNTLIPDDSSQDSVQSVQTSSSTDDSKSKLKVRAQRKFAQMMAYGNSMTPSQMTPVKQTNKTSPIKVFPKRAKTEDFLTFLCLRGTQVLPPHLDFFNFSRDDGDSSCPPTPSNGGHPGSSTRESSPSSSSSCISHMDFDNFFGRVTPNRKAARACAGTPETARGLASIGRGSKSQNGSPLISKKRRPNRSPAVTPSKSTRSLTSGNPQKLSPLKRGKSISPTKSTASDRLAIKKKALATLRGSKMSPIKKQERKKSLFQDTGSNTRSMDSKVMTKVEIDHFVCSRGVVELNRGKPRHTYLGIACNTVDTSAELADEQNMHAFPYPLIPYFSKSSSASSVAWKKGTERNPSKPLCSFKWDDMSSQLDESLGYSSFETESQVPQSLEGEESDLISSVTNNSFVSIEPEFSNVFIKPSSVINRRSLMKSMHLVEKCPIRAGACIHPTPAPPLSASRPFKPQQLFSVMSKETIDVHEDSGIMADLSINDSVLDDSSATLHVQQKQEIESPSEALQSRMIQLKGPGCTLFPLPPPIMTAKIAPSIHKQQNPKSRSPSSAAHILTPPLDLLVPAHSVSQYSLGMPVTNYSKIVNPAPP